MKKHYVYIHRKLTNLEVFYVGLGSQKDYSRAYTPHGRNKFWEAVVKKHNFFVQVVAIELSLEEACDLEIDLIHEYGRRDKNEGTLTNLTDGGEGTVGILYDPERIQNWRDSIGDNLYDITQHIKTGRESNRAQEVINLETGIFYETAKIATESQHLTYSCMKQMLNNSRHNYTSFRYVEDYINGTPIVVKTEIGVKTINEEGIIFDTIVSCSKHYKVSENKIHSILSGRVYNEIGIKYLNRDNSKIKYKKYLYVSNKTGEKFKSTREASEILGIKRDTIKTWLYHNRNQDIICKI